MDLTTYKDFAASTQEDQCAEGLALGYAASGQDLSGDFDVAAAAKPRAQPAASATRSAHLTYRDLRHIWCMGVDNGLIGQLHKHEWGLLVGRNPGAVDAFNRVCCIDVSERNLRTAVETFRFIGANPPLDRPIRSRQSASQRSWIEVTPTPMSPKELRGLGAGLGGNAPRDFCSVGAVVTQVLINGRLRPVSTRAIA
jgi:hypothetical protein